MRISAINSFKNSFAPKIKQNNFKQNNISYTSSPSFEGIFDVFRKQPKELTPEERDSRDINEILQSAITGDKALIEGGKVFLKHLNRLLKVGKEQNYKGYLHFEDKKAGKNLVTFSDVNEEMGIPPIVNVWQNGKLKTVYEILSVTPQSLFTVTTYDDNRECFYQFINDKNLCFQSLDKNGIFIAQYPAENGFCQQQSKKVNDKDALLYYELYWDYKNTENSYFLQNTDGDAIRYCFNKKSKFWYPKEIIPYELKGEIPTYDN